MSTKQGFYGYHHKLHLDKTQREINQWETKTTKLSRFFDSLVDDQPTNQSILLHYWQCNLNKQLIC